MIELYIAIFMILAIVLPLIFLYLPNDFRLTGIGILYSVLMLMLLYFNFSINIATSTIAINGGINERVQNYVEQRIGIKKLILGLNSNPNTDNPYDNLFYSAFKNTRSYSFRGTKESSSGAIYVRLDGPPDIVPTKDKIVYWCESTYFQGNNSFIIWNISNRHVNNFFVLAGIGGLLFFLCVYFFTKSYLMKKGRWNETYTLPLLLSTLFLPCIITLCFWQIPGFSAEHFLNPIISKVVTWEEPQRDMEKILKNTSEVSLVSSPVFLKIFCKPNVFVSKKPLFPHNYVRINLDIFNYLFYAPEVNSLKEINPLMEYTKLADGIWLGSYTEYNSLRARFMIIPYICLFSIWLAFIVLIIGCYRLINKEKSKILEQATVLSGSAVLSGSVHFT
jgi:hypothetical protein